MATHRSLILAFAALPLLIGGAAAQDAGRYRNWDVNSDGVITRTEWRGTVQEFRELDLNRDRVLSGAELQGDDRETSPTWDAQSFADLDRNNDGRVSRGEWVGDRATFLRVDRNGDNQITRGEFMNANVGTADTEFGGRDSDGSGRIELDEWNGTRAAFNRLDVNRDGALTPRELAARDATPANVDEFDIVDVNNDGAIARGEWRGSRGSFDQRDVNNDGVITRREYSTADAGPLGGAVQERIRVDGRQAWTSTGIHVNVGDVVNYRAVGNIQMSTNPEDRATPAGSLTGRNANNSPRPDQKAGGLLIRIGNASVGFLGANGSFTAQNSGEVFLGVNDDHFGDNSGEFRVALSINQR